MQRKGETMKNYNSLLTLQKLVFDKIEFDRKGFKNKNELTFELQVQVYLLNPLKTLYFQGFSPV